MVCNQYHTFSLILESGNIRVDVAINFGSNEQPKNGTTPKVSTNVPHHPISACTAQKDDSHSCDNTKIVWSRTWECLKW